METTENELEYDEFGKPLSDGYVTIIFNRMPICQPIGEFDQIDGMQGCIATIHDQEITAIREHSQGLVIQSTNCDVVYKWCDIAEYMQTHVSDTFMDAISMYRMECGDRPEGHSWLPEVHSVFGCSRTCGRCDLIENPHADGRHPQ